jgi:uncharacterized protein involved in exopolysaccharide biosynthesis
MPVLRVLGHLVAFRRTVLLAALGLGGLVAVLTIASPRQYESRVTLLPQNPDQGASGWSGLASQLGISVGLTGGAQSPDFYASLLGSEGLLTSIADTSYVIHGRIDPWRFWLPEEEHEGTLVELFGLGHLAPRIATEKAIARLYEKVQVNVDPAAGTVRLRVTTRWPELSLALATRFVEEVGAFNLNTRQFQARAERRFLEERVRAAESELRLSEEALEAFLVSNREWEGSPPLSFAHDRLLRSVQLRQQSYASLSQALEQARIEEVRNTPVLTIVSEPRMPARPMRRHLLLKTMAGTTVGLLIGVLTALGRLAFDEAGARSPDERARLQELRNEVAQDVRRLVPWRRNKP